MACLYFNIILASLQEFYEFGRQNVVFKSWLSCVTEFVQKVYSNYSTRSRFSLFTSKPAARIEVKRAKPIKSSLPRLSDRTVDIKRI
jgi:hypothetical protein